MKRVLSLALICVLIMSLTACSEKTELQDGYYTAQASEFNHGWKPTSPTPSAAARSA